MKEKVTTVLTDTSDVLEVFGQGSHELLDISRDWPRQLVNWESEGTELEKFAKFPVFILCGLNLIGVYAMSGIISDISFGASKSIRGLNRLLN